MIWRYGCFDLTAIFRVKNRVEAHETVKKVVKNISGIVGFHWLPRLMDTVRCLA